MGARSHHPKPPLLLPLRSTAATAAAPSECLSIHTTPAPFACSCNLVAEGRGSAGLQQIAFCAVLRHMGEDQDPSRVMEVLAHIPGHTLAHLLLLVELGPPLGERGSGEGSVVWWLGGANLLCYWLC